MSKLKQLISALCPDGVEYKKLIDITSVLRGKRLTKRNLIQNATYPVFHGGLEPLGYYTEKNRPANTVMIINVGASAGTVGYCDVDFWSSDGCYCLEHSTLFDNKYVYYALLCCEKVLKSKVRYAGIPTLDSVVIEKLQIPLPPIPVQREIVRILDNFTELTARKKQYEYYRDGLLTFSNDVQRKTLGTIVNLSRGARVVRSQLNGQDKYPVYQNSMTPLGYYSESNYRAKTTFIISAGAAGSVGYSDVDFWAADDCYCLICPEGLDSRYLYHTLTNQQDYIFSQVRKASVPRIGRDAVERIKIPIPHPNDIDKSLKEQQHIVDILDRFDTLCNSISSGLPAEIKARQQQYEYYRDKLLAFKKLDVEV